MSALPLKRLLQGNLIDAEALGLIDVTDLAAKEFIDRVESSWEADPSADKQLDCFDVFMLDAMSDLYDAYRLIQPLRGKTVHLSHVRTLSQFANTWAPAIAAKADPLSLAVIARRDGKIRSNMDAATEACLKFTDEFGFGPPRNTGTRFNAQAIRSRTPSFWISKKSAVSDSQQAQHWRDRLGLIHIQGDTAPIVGHGLVRMELGVTLAASDLLSGDPAPQLFAEPEGIWLIRPTMVHRGNQRFVQRHRQDGHSLRRRWLGRTRDLAIPSFAAGERELLLVYGEAATIRFRKVEMLQGIPGEITARDNTDATFVDAIAIERAWPQL